MHATTALDADSAPARAAPAPACLYWCLSCLVNDIVTVAQAVSDPGNVVEHEHVTCWDSCENKPHTTVLGRTKT